MVTGGYQGDPTNALSITKDPAVFWACPDIWVGQPGGTTASQGHNEVGVRFQYDRSLDLFNAVQVEVFVSDPTLAPPPGSFVPHGSGVYQLPDAFVASDDFGPTSSVAVLDLDVPAPDPLQPGAGTIATPNSHRCLIARVYPPGTSVPREFDVNDQHSAQRNIFIAGATGEPEGPSAAGVGAGDVGSPGGAPLVADTGWWTFLVNAWATDTEARTQVVTLDLVYDVDPGIFWDSMGEVLAEQGITQVRNLAPERTGLLVGETIVEGSEEGTTHSMVMAPGTSATIGLLADLSGLHGATAYALHARQSVALEDAQEGVPAGAATVLFHRVDLTDG